MKNAVLVLVNMVLGTLTVMIIMTMYGRVNRSMELKSNLSSALEETLENAMLNQTYAIQNTEELVADLIQMIIHSFDAQTDMQVDIWQCDKEKGILSLKVGMLYKHPNGADGKIESEKTVIFNRKNTDAVPIMHRVEFYVEGECYKVYQVKEHSSIGAPAEPKLEGKVFLGWLNEDGAYVDIEQSVTTETRYFADFR